MYHTNINLDDVFFDAEELTDEELDALYRPKKSNSRKSLAPLFVYRILTEATDSEHHLTQKEIAEKLEAYPYEISLERKALSRVIHNLEDTGFGIISAPKKGVWFDADEIWA